jgi:hypothetical protein
MGTIAASPTSPVFHAFSGLRERSAGRFPEPCPDELVTRDGDYEFTAGLGIREQWVALSKCRHVPDCLVPGLAPGIQGTMTISTWNLGFRLSNRRGRFDGPPLGQGAQQWEHMLADNKRPHWLLEKADKE